MSKDFKHIPKLEIDKKCDDFYQAAYEISGGSTHNMFAMATTYMISVIKTMIAQNPEANATHEDLMKLAFEIVQKGLDEKQSTEFIRIEIELPDGTKELKDISTEDIKYLQDKDGRWDIERLSVYIKETYGTDKD